METREPILAAAVGKKGVGKTYLTTQYVQTYSQTRKVLILDVNDEYSHIRGLAPRDVMKFSVYPTIEARRIRPFNDDGTRMTTDVIVQTMHGLLQNFRGGLLLLEDINKYISDSMPNDLIGAICTNRHQDLDIILHYQSFSRMVPKIIQNLSMIRWHKCTDSVERWRNKYPDKYEICKLAELMVDKQYYSGNDRFYLWVDLENEKLRGIDPKMFDDACTEYFATNYKRVVAPLLQQRSGNGEKTYSPDTAKTFLRQKMKSQYL